MPNRTCTIIEDGVLCDGRHLARGMCAKHYYRWRTNGNPLVVQQIRDDELRRFWSKIERRDDAECWPWVGTTDRDGYGVFTYYRQGKQKHVRAHRYAYELMVGPIPEGLVIDHVRNNGCIRKDCVNWVRHLEPVTGGKNVLRGDSIPALNARKTHCHRGHEFTPENTILSAKEERNCREYRTQRRGSA